ncbi:MAG: sigma-70 family RNA polymerase sigma factor [Planctomycetales bacterium]|nr:sigma-70 family RNA polymerase sigma factor [Planctomycetales bacterium]
MKSKAAAESVIVRRRCATDDQQRRGEFVQQFSGIRPRLAAYVRSVVANPSDAEDVLQEIGVVLWSKFGEFELGSDFERWAFRTARLQVLCYYKRQRREPIRFTDRFIEQVDEASLARTDLARACEALRDCIARLEPEDRELFRRRYESSQPTSRQLARELGRPESTVYNALSRIRRRLMHCMRRTLGDA